MQGSITKPAPRRGVSFSFPPGKPTNRKFETLESNNKIRNLDLRKRPVGKASGKQSLISYQSYTGGFEGAAQTKRWFYFPAPSTGPNIAAKNIGYLRRRSREIIRNSPYIAGAVDSYISNLIGSGITARWEDSQVQNLWEDWILSLDLEGILDFYGLQELSARSIYESGECLIRIVSVDADSRMVPLRIQLLEPDHLDHLYNNPRTTSGGSIKYGIEFDSKNRRVAYHIFESHPSEAGSVDGRRVRVPADGMILAYDIRRPGQLRGIPWTHSVLTRINEIDQARNAELIRRKTTAMFGGFVTFPPDEEIGDSNILGETKTTGSGVEISALEPGQFVGLPAGSDIRLSTPSDVTGSYIDWMRDAHREVAKGLRVTFEQLTGDLTQVNFSSIRAGLNEFRRLCAQTRNKIVIQMICRPISRAFYESAISAGLVSDLSYFPGGRVPVSWHPDPWAYVKPSEDVQAEIDQVKAGFKSRSDVVAERGRDARSVDARVFEDNDRTRQAGIRYTTDVYKEEEE